MVKDHADSTEGQDGSVGLILQRATDANPVSRPGDACPNPELSLDRKPDGDQSDAGIFGSNENCPRDRAMSDDAQIEFNRPPHGPATAPVAAALSTTTKSVLFLEKAVEPSEEPPAESSIVQSLNAFRAPYRRMLRAGIAVMLVVLAMEWIVIANRRPDRLLQERGHDYREQFQVEINSATWVEWLQLEGIGPTTAHRIVADRKLNGPFLSIDDVGRVAGIGPVTLDRIRPWLTMGHDINDSRTAAAGIHGPSKLQP